MEACIGLVAFPSKLDAQSQLLRAACINQTKMSLYTKNASTRHNIAHGGRNMS